LLEERQGQQAQKDKKNKLFFHRYSPFSKISSFIIRRL
jgi:hypothetical protein